HFGTLRFSDAPTVNLLAYTFSFGNGFSATLALEEGRFDGIANPFFVGPADPTAGQRVPDVVANVKYAGTWGSAQLSGAVHQLRSVALVDAAGLGFIPDTEYGFAVSFQGSVNLPMLAAGDALWIAATYADGALGYLGFGGGDVDDAIIDADGDIDTTQGWSVAGGLRHYWTPEIRQ
ncbi:porin, partial [Microvirga sp. G4-2]|uniref:porin n=1 Tax=Microvirga sp. G4-2 TaxID=3434467 RepID=UPI0040440C22